MKLALTLHERASNLLAAVDGCETGEQAIAAIESALRDVVEECAKVATDQPIDDRWSPHWYNGAAMMQEHIAAALRRLKEERG